MQSFIIKPEIKIIDTIEEFLSSYCIDDHTVIFTTQIILDIALKNKVNHAIIINYDQFGQGEPNDLTAEKIYNFLQGKTYHCVFAIGGGTILDIAKLFALKTISPVVELFEGKIKPMKDKELILVPTTCGTGSEMTNISILELTALNTKFGLANEELYADQAILCPEFLKDLPMSVFATSSIDALIHAIESYTSPKANELTMMYSKQAIQIIIKGYQKIIQDASSRKSLNKDFLMASSYAGIAFSNAGCAAVHALSYPLGAKYHIPHGESNYAIFTGVYKAYMQIKPNGKIQMLNLLIADLLKCSPDNVYNEIEKLFNQILKKKSLKEYGVTLEDLEDFTQAVIEKQGRLMANNYVPLDASQVKQIYINLYE